MGSHKSAGEFAPEEREKMQTTGGQRIFAAAAALKTAAAPIERAKLLLQVQGASKSTAADKRYRGIIDLLVRVPKEQGGFGALWRGNQATALRCSTVCFSLSLKDYFRDGMNKGLDKKSDFYKCALGNFAAGGAAGATLLPLTHLFAFMQTRLMADIGVGESRKYKQFIYALTNTGGCQGLLRGFAVGLQGVIIYRSVCFGLFDTAKMSIEAEGKKMNFLSTFLLAQASTTTAGLLSYPWDTVRRRMMMQAGREEILYKSAWDCVRKVVEYEGKRALFKGALANVLRGAAGAMLIALYEKMQRKKYTSCGFLDPNATRD